MQRKIPSVVSFGKSILIEQVPPDQRRIYERVADDGWSRLRNRILQPAEKWLCDHPDARIELKESGLSLRRLFDVDVFFKIITPGRLNSLLSSTQMVSRDRLQSDIREGIRKPCPEPFRGFLEDRCTIFVEWICQGIIEGVEAGDCYPWKYYPDSPIFRDRESVEKEIAYLMEGMEGIDTGAPEVMAEERDPPEPPFDPRDLGKGERGKAIAIRVSADRSGVHDRMKIARMIDKAKVPPTSKNPDIHTAKDWAKKDPDGFWNYLSRLKKEGQSLEQELSLRIPDTFFKKYQ